MKVVVIGTRGIPAILGGVETHCEELFPRIVQKGVDVTVVRRECYVSDSLQEYRNVKLVNLATPRSKSLEAIVHTFRAILKAKSLHADIVHVHAVGPALLTPLIRLLGMKAVFTHHGPDYDRDKWGKTAKFMLKMGEWMGCLFANEVIVISEVINDILVRKYNRRDCHLVYNGVSVPDRVTETDSLQELRVQSRKYIFAMGRFVPEKNFHHLIHAFAALKDSNYKLVLAGDADLEDDYSRYLKSLAKEKGVVLTGFIKGKKLHELLSHACCFVLPSSHEGLPIALLEAMSYDLPVIVSNIPANLEVGLDYNCYFQTGNEQQLREKISEMLSGEFSPVHYSMDEYNWDRIAEQVIAVYNEMV